ncbi:tripartite tricarboxylate transporter substrate binding protein [soil metagenome]
MLTTRTAARRWKLTGQARAIAAAFALSLVAITAAPALAQGEAWPTRPLRLVVPFPAGGSNDIAARVLAPKLSAALGQNVVVENRAGASGSIGVDNVAKSPPDGYSIVLTAPGAVAINQHFRKLPYDIDKDLAPISVLGTVPTLVAVNAAIPVRTPAEFVAWAKKQPESISMSVSGTGSQTHLASELLAATAGYKMVAVAYKGTQPAATAIASGEVPAGISDLTTLQPLIKSGRVRAIGVVDARSPTNAPEILPMATVLPGFLASGWIGLLTTGGTPAAIVQRLNAEVVKAMALPEVRDAFITAGLEPASSTPEEFGSFLRTESAKWGKVINDNNIKAE